MRARRPARAAPGCPAEKPSTDCRSAASRSRHGGRVRRCSGDQVPRSSRSADDGAGRRAATSAATPPSPAMEAAAARWRAARPRRPPPSRAPTRRRPGCRSRATPPRRAWPGDAARQEDLGGLAGEQAERRDVADRVAGEKAAQRRRRTAAAPRAACTAARPACAAQKRSAGEREDRRTGPSRRAGCRRE